PMDSLENKETGAYVRRRMSDSLDMKLNLLQKNDSDDLWSMEANAKLGKTADLQMEYGSGGADEAYRASLSGSTQGLYYQIGKTHAGPNYRGYYRDNDFTNGSVVLPISERLSLNLSGQKWEENLSRDPSKYDAPSESSYRTGLSYALASDTGISLSYDCFNRKDLLDTRRYDSRERSLRLGVSKSFGNASLQAYLERGEQDDLLSGESYKTDRYSLFYTLRASARGYLSLYAQMGDDRPAESRLLGGGNTSGISGTWELRNNLSLSASYAVNGFNSDNEMLSRQLYLTTVYRLPDDSCWTLHLRQADRSGGEKDSVFMLSYSLPWDIPVSRKSNIGTIRGRVYDGETPDRRGIARTIVTLNGMRTATNGDGEFAFSSLSPGKYTVTIDQGSIGLDRISSAQLPMIVDVVSGETKDIDLSVVRSARVFGRVAACSYQETGPGRLSAGIFLEGSSEYCSTSGELVEKEGISNVLVEISNGSEIYRRLTDKTGEFSLEGIRPGRWCVRAYDYNLPAYYYLETPETEMELKPGQAENVLFRTLPRLRPIKTVDQGTLVSER
ncbi:MAG: hypothetical protein ACYC08_05635, partial [Armatimonadota bacterium]